MNWNTRRAIVTRASSMAPARRKCIAVHPFPDTSFVTRPVARPIVVMLAVFSAAWSWPALAQSLAPFAPSETNRTVFRNATLIDGAGGPPRNHMDILVDGERIEKIVPDGELDVATMDNAKVIDVTGRFVMPGLIDAHVHLATPPNRRQAEAVLRRDIYGGVTAVRDLADDLRAVGDIARAGLVGEIAAPDIYYAALMAGPSFFTDKRTAMVSAGAPLGQAPWLQAVTDKTDILLAIAEARGTYATAIKLYADITPALAARITTEAHRQHLLVWAHATLYPAKPSEVVAAGVDTISHACLLVREPDVIVPRWTEPHPPVNLTRFRDGRNPALSTLFADMLRRGTILDATIWAYGPNIVDSTVPPPQPGACDDNVAGIITGQAYRAGVPIDAGTDNVADWSDPWPDLFHELAAMADKAGMPTAAILKAATLTSARAAGQARDMGSIEPGKLANMVILARNPLANLQNLASVVMTVKRGHLFPRGDYVPLQAADITDR